MNPSLGRAFTLAVRVYYEDTDAGGVVYYANYLKFMERCRSEWLRSLGFDVAALARAQNAIFAVRGAEIEFRRPARLSDELRVSAMLAGLRSASLEIEHEAHRGEELLCRARVRLACLNAGSFTPMPIPDNVREAVERWRTS
jgi:acyl-CoA thioester hydrolase